MVISPPVHTEFSEIIQRYREDMEAIRLHHEAGEDSRVVVREITDSTDAMVIRLLLQHLKEGLGTDELPKHILLLAQGGYGRRHQHPQSDIDLLFLYKESLNPAEQRLVGNLFRSLFDLGFKVGHCCRSYSDALDMLQKDHESQTAMKESRFLAGDWRLFERFKHDLWRILQRNRREQIRIKIQEREKRIARYGSTINITEPNVKESPGGLRGFHFGLWIGSLLQGQTLDLLHMKRLHLIDDQMMTRVEQAVAFLWRLRNDLHFLTGKEQDVLSLSIQQEIAHRLGYTDRAFRLAEEEMMRDYYTHALTISNFAEHMAGLSAPKPFWTFLRSKRRKSLGDGFALCDGMIFIPKDIHFYEHFPQRILMTFFHAAEQSASLSPETAMAIHDNLDLVDQAFLHDKHNAALLWKFFSMERPIEPALQMMRRAGLLERLFPEWRSISSLVRYDLVHRYTVDEHSLLCLYHLEHLRDDAVNYREERFLLWKECPEKDLLRMAVLFHDIGKGREGDHSKVGAQLVDEIARRVRLSDDKRERLIFFVRHHLNMSHTAQHRDLSDPIVAADFSDMFERVEDLDIMYLLTYVDMRSVSPEAMTEWKNNLLWQLYLASRDIFLSETPTLEDSQRQVVSRKEKVIKSLAADFDRSVIEDHLKHLPPSYLLNQSTKNIRQHLEMVQEFDRRTPVTRIIPHFDSGCIEIMIVYKDSVGLFNRLCTAVMLENFDIMEARLNTRSDGIVANSIVVRDALGHEVVSQERQQLLQERIRRILTMEGPPPKAPKPLGRATIGRSSFENTVKISNECSTRFTVVVIRCADRAGLLQDLTFVLSNRQINIHFARIITEGNRVTDVFYTANSSGEKLAQTDVDSLMIALQEKIEPADGDGCV
ncbi:MAG: [protein-PII] uridylyltransferase [Candidatus Omnitrophica bacterium]|nr:[protein-PII] uridylyltransferase [Candidatus Omnitrophota bacterium]